jgi:hypothetical protein
MVIILFVLFAILKGTKKKEPLILNLLRGVVNDQDNIEKITLKSVDGVLETLH